MMNKLEKKFKRCLVVSMASIIAISLMGCECKELAKGDAVNKETVVEKNSVNQNNKPVDKSKIDDGKRNFKDYISLLGLSKEKLISTLKEKPSSIGEGGVEFKEAGIRVWFDKKSNTQVDQVFTMRKDTNLIV
ncbi:hypothetical protein [Clostridium magnum]|uniref:Lipoprotein n=1 Tax=Clostridium magnum DSM 2767 TaxID=1121326 RepID=A0A162RXK1_9CLOT|nr:hypothetical protein [Clostridium magnum]KZL90513.1 hypothetical protein CLMAG_42850 [Clostridium magnum DSM 2767]SHI04279.1 hypothetical protein SAMN02745944_02207 [Clostridium magnum DSM 2767]